MSTSSKQDAASSRPFGRLLMLGVLLLAGWLLWSGFFKPLLLALGVLSCAITLYIVKRMGYFDNDTYVFHYKRGFIGFWLWLSVEVVRSALEVTRVVLRRELKIETKIVTIDAADLDLVSQAVLGNAITLTPGTLTMDVDNGRLLVHTLTPEGAAALQEGEMLRRVQALGGS